MVIDLSRKGFAAYLIEPGNGDAFYRVRVGPFPTRAAATDAAGELGKVLGMKLWVTRGIQ